MKPFTASELRNITADLGGTAVYTPSGGEAVTTSAIVDVDVAEIDSEIGKVVGRTVLISLPYDDVTSPATGDTIVISGLSDRENGTYRVTRLRENTGYLVEVECVRT